MDSLATRCFSVGCSCSVNEATSIVNNVVHVYISWIMRCITFWSAYLTSELADKVRVLECLMVIVILQCKRRRACRKLCARMELDMEDLMVSSLAPLRIALTICTVLIKKCTCVQCGTRRRLHNPDVPRQGYHGHCGVPKAHNIQQWLCIVATEATSRRYGIQTTLTRVPDIS